jgi:hypothetical protein
VSLLLLFILYWPEFYSSLNRDDITRSIATLAPLGNGLEIINLNNRIMIASVPQELNLDYSKVIKEAQKHGYITANELSSGLGWNDERVTNVLV